MGKQSVLDTGRALNRWLDHMTGLDRQKPGLRSRLVTEQVRAIIEMTPGMATGSLLVSLMILYVTWGSAAFTSMLVWSAALLAVLAWGMRAWLRMKSKGLRAASSRAIRRATLHAGLLGSIWGTLPVLFVTTDIIPGGGVTSAITVSVVLCASAIALSAIPVALLSFSGPVVFGSMIAILNYPDALEAQVFLMLLLSYLAVMPWVGLVLARKFVNQLASEAQVREQNDIISLLLKEFEENSSDWLWEFDADGRIDRVSDRFAAAAGVAGSDIVKRDFLDFLREFAPQGRMIVDEIAQDIENRSTFSGVELRLQRDDAEIWWRLTGKPAHDESGTYIGYIGTASDVTGEKLAERRINFLAHNDALTGLLNRAKFTDHLKQCVARLERYGSAFAVLFLDLDQFKSVNDSRGHLIGDRLLVEVGRRISGSIRDSDVAARLGGDEFAIILTAGCDAEGAGTLAARLVETIGKPYEFDGEVVLIGASIGIAMAPVNGTRPDQILRNADLALYRAKEGGRGIHRFFESQMDSDMRERRMLELELRQAIKDDELVLHYQPLVSAETNRPSGFEALVRWNHPIRGMVAPAEFIPIAEQSGLIMQIGDWTIREACFAASRWPHDMLVAVNLSVKHFQMSDIVEVVRQALSDSGLSPNRLELEITESLLIEHSDDVIAKLTEIKALGVTIAMDDFGTGYSSLAYLLKFPFDKIKIDKSFVTASSEDTVAKDILRSIASLGKTLKIRITAEGVETQEQVDFLRDIACHQLQGFYFAKPLDEPAMASYFLHQFQGDLTLSETGSVTEWRAAS